MSEEYLGPERRDVGWHLKKEVHITTIITILIACGTGTAWLSSLRNDIDMHWQAFTYHVEQQEKNEQAHYNRDREMLTKLEVIGKDLTDIKVSIASIKAKENKK